MSGRFIELSGATRLRMGVTPCGRNRMWKYHSSVVEKGFTPRVIACRGSDLNSPR